MKPITPKEASTMRHQWEPANDDAAEVDGEAVRIEAVEGRSGSGEHRWGPFEMKV